MYPYKSEGQKDHINLRVLHAGLEGGEKVEQQFWERIARVCAD